MPSNPPTMFSPENAAKVLATLQSDPEETWTYKIDDHADGAKYRTISCFDEDGVFCGSL
jgi:hypothetical protein